MYRRRREAGGSVEVGQWPHARALIPAVKLTGRTVAASLRRTLSKSTSRGGRWTRGHVHRRQAPRSSRQMPACCTHPSTSISLPTYGAYALRRPTYILIRAQLSPHPLLPRRRHPTRPVRLARPLVADVAGRAARPRRRSISHVRCARTGYIRANSPTPRSPTPPRDPPCRARSAARECTGRSARAAPGRDVARPSAAGVSHGPHIAAARRKSTRAPPPLARNAIGADLRGRIPTSRHSRKSPRALPTQQQRPGRTLLPIPHRPVAFAASPRARAHPRPQLHSRAPAICASMPAMRDPNESRAPYPPSNRAVPTSPQSTAPARPPSVEMRDPGVRPKSAFGSRRAQLRNARFYKSRAPQFYESRAPQLSSARTRATSTNKCANFGAQRAARDTPSDASALATRRPPPLRKTRRSSQLPPSRPAERGRLAGAANSNLIVLTLARIP
ncbi:hypothetical protein B0H15DRAFT_344277 [Mycena belliarum]|uniref:Uncharacterized protein n=1 Tax=Mycena belliarum TaxID=1033014 RepID=A0AAD6U1J2_9AGAR|nr:hypothetical protein B0H15DRAFT_344277 [Mycena belliae]